MNLAKSTEGAFVLNLFLPACGDFAFFKMIGFRAGSLERGFLISSMSNASELLLEGLLVSVMLSSSLTLFLLFLSSSHEVSVLSCEKDLLPDDLATAGARPDTFLLQTWKIHLNSLSAASLPNLENSLLHVTKPLRKGSATSKHLKPQYSQSRPLFFKWWRFSKNFRLKSCEPELGASLGFALA
jgi:hypothetical protein